MTRRNAPPYRPRPGTMAEFALAHLRATDEPLTLTEVARAIGVPPYAASGVFRDAIKHGLVAVVLSDDDGVKRYVSTAPAPAGPRRGFDPIQRTVPALGAPHLAVCAPRSVFELYATNP